MEKESTPSPQQVKKILTKCRGIVSSCEWNLASFRYNLTLFFIESWGTFLSIHHKVLSNTEYAQPAESSAQKILDSVEQQSWRTLTALQDRYKKEAERKGVGAAMFGKDRKLKKTPFKKKSNDGFT